MPLTRFRVTERQVLTLLMVASVLGVGAAILGSSFLGGHGRKLEPVTRAHIQTMRPAGGGLRAVVADDFDPSRMSKPSPHGFSQGPCRHLAPPLPSRYQPLRPAAFLAAPTELEQPTLLEQAPLRTVIEAGLERPVFPVADEMPALTHGPAVTNSVVQVDGALAERRLVQVPAIPLAPPLVMMRRSVVQVAVGADGRVRHAVLERPGGNVALDTEAVELARQLRFAPQVRADALGVTWGTVRFLWANAAGD